jgi:hypothetical protein
MSRQTFDTNYFLLLPCKISPTPSFHCHRLNPSHSGCHFLICRATVPRFNSQVSQDPLSSAEPLALTLSVSRIAQGPPKYPELARLTSPHHFISITFRMCNLISVLSSQSLTINSQLVFSHTRILAYVWQVATLLEHAATDPVTPEFQPIILSRKSWN